jgi:hypothetical protein
MASHAALAMLLVFAPAATVWADDAHYQFELSVEAPSSTEDSFHVHVTETLVGAKAGVQMSVIYNIVVIEPSGEQHVLQGPVSETNNFGGGQQHANIGYWPRQNGEFTFRVVQLDGPKQTVLVERRVTTDRAAVLGPVSVPNTRPDGQFAVTGLRTDPPQPIVGETVNVQVDAANTSTESVTRTLPIVFADDSGEQLVATGTFTLAPGLSGTGHVTWIPQRATTGLLEAGDQTVPITILDSPPAASADSSDQQGIPGDTPDNVSEN